MTTLRRASALVSLIAALAASPVASGIWIPTNFGNGADAEVRESDPNQNRGASNEIAMRVATDFRNSAIYLKFDLTGIAPAPGLQSALRLTYRNNNLTESRIQDSVTPDPSVRVGIQVFGLNPAATGANWDETTITYFSAPGLTPDNNVNTKDFNSDLIPLGVVQYPEIGSQNHLPIGDALIFSSPLLDQFVFDTLDAGFAELTLVTALTHDGNALAAWTNFQYLFNPKEKLILNDDSGYDADVSDPNNPLGGPHSLADNTNGAFSPSLLIDGVRQAPEPGTILLLGIGLVAMRLTRRVALSEVCQCFH